MSGIRFHVEPGDVPANVAARRIGLSIEAFNEKLPELANHGFPNPNPVTGNYCLEAVDAWRKAFYPHLLDKPSLTAGPVARNADDVVRLRLAGKSGG
jgi:hypothetical protein